MDRRETGCRKRAAREMGQRQRDAIARRQENIRAHGAEHDLKPGQIEKSDRWRFWNMMGKTPKVEARFHGGLQKVFQDKTKQVELSGARSIRGFFDALCNSPERRRQIFDDQGQIRSDLTILRNGRNIEFLSSLDTELNDGDTVTIFLPVFGG